MPELSNEMTFTIDILADNMHGDSLVHLVPVYVKFKVKGIFQSSPSQMGKIHTRELFTPPIGC